MITFVTTGQLAEALREAERSLARHPGPLDTMGLDRETRIALVMAKLAATKEKST